ncbi:MAG: p-hydroxybenzoic acid efflux pump subunit AaeA, partial [Enterobacterales bacterium]|nr:p-hydroxybenzoic acid efflux pump subunit AaeA [Enterobacterales bacterium]
GTTATVVVSNQQDVVRKSSSPVVQLLHRLREFG